MNFVISVGQIATSRLYALPLPLPEPLQNILCMPALTKSYNYVAIVFLDGTS